VEISKLWKWNLHVSNLTFQELQHESKIKAIGAQKLKASKIGQNMNQVVSAKGALTCKMAMFGGFPEVFHKRIDTVSASVIKKI